jgi:chemotaxis-related protein WspB
MLFLQFELRGDRYLLDTAQVAEVLPRVALKAYPRAPAGVAGVANLRGQAVPVLDFGLLAGGEPAADRLSTRLILVHYPSTGGSTRLLGLVAEHATEVVRLEPAALQPAGVSAPEAPWLGEVGAAGNGKLAQRVRVEELVPAELRTLLFEAAETAFPA